MNGQDVMRRQLRERSAGAAFSPEQVICCGHNLDAHDDDGCTVGWTPADERRKVDGCTCRVKGWAR